MEQTKTTDECECYGCMKYGPERHGLTTMQDANILTQENSELRARVEAYEAMFEAAKAIDGEMWSISNNGNPEKLIALRQFDVSGNLLSYTHHDTVLEAFAALKTDEGER